jgi:hypothetical protein
MSKIIYTERDVDKLHARGITEVEVNDDVYLTDLARERLEKFGMKYRTVPLGQARVAGVGAAPGGESASPAAGVDKDALVEKVRASVIARVGPGVDAAVVDKIVRGVVSQL